MSKDNILSIALALSSGILIAVLALGTEGAFGGADSYQHYLISKYSFYHPELFLHHWGKPVFTLLSSSFAAMGFSGIKIFNVLCMVATALISVRILKKLDVKIAPLVILPIVFTPIYFQCAFSGLTEPLFSLFLVGSIALFLDKRYRSAAILLSFLPLVRTEGIMMFPLFILGFSAVRKFLAIPWLLTGILFYSLMGWIFYHHDPLWLLNEMPYGSAGSIYGQGDFWHYGRNIIELLGWPLTIGLGLGAIALPFSFMKADEERKKAGWFIIVVALVGYFFAHSILWATGRGSSLGLLRIMAGVTPLAAIIAVGGIDRLLLFAKGKKVLTYSIAVPLLLTIPVFSFIDYDELTPAALNFEELAMKEAAEYLEENDLTDRTVHFFNPSVCFFADLDMFDHAKTRWATDKSKNYKQGDIVVWDAHFGPNEGNVDRESLVFGDNWEYRHRIVTDSGAIVLGGYNYEVIIFEYYETPVTKAIPTSLYSHDFESTIAPAWVLKPENHTKERFASDSTSYTMDGGTQFLEACHLPLDSLAPQFYSSVRASAKVYFPKASDQYKTHLVITNENNGEMLEYQVHTDSVSTPGQWVDFDNELLIQPNVPAGTRLKVYLWYEGADAIFVDDFNVNFTTRHLIY